MPGRRGTVGQRAFEAPLQILEVFDADAAADEQLAGDCSMRRSALLFYLMESARLLVEEKEESQGALLHKYFWACSLSEGDSLK